MKKAIIAFALAIPMLASCSQTERSTAIGAGAGAIIGGVATGRVGGAVVGAAVGGTAGYLIGRSHRPHYCIYRDRHGNRYEARCR